jgi:hypothetical protein
MSSGGKFASRLAKLEELIASQVNKPIATVWVDVGETQEQACVRCGHDPALAPMIMFIRWLDPQLGETPPEFSWDVPEPGPPKDGAGQNVSRDAQRSEIGETPVARNPTPDLDEAETRYRAAIEEREREVIAEKLHDAAKAFAKSIC